MSLYVLTALVAAILVAVNQQVVIDTLTFGAGAIVAFAVVIVSAWLRSRAKRKSAA